MGHNLPRRAFLKTFPMAAGMLASPAPHAASAKAVKAADVPISGTTYTPVPDYPIRPKRYSEVTLRDTFWKPKIDTIARVTIPFEVRKMNPEGARLGFNGNVLEAAILSLATHPDPELQAQVDARIAALKQATYRGNTGFEAAVTWYQVTGKRDLLEKSSQAANALYEDFKVRKPPFSGGERDA